MVRKLFRKKNKPAPEKHRERKCGFVPVSGKELDYLIECIYDEVGSMEVLSNQAKSALVQTTLGQVVDVAEGGKIFIRKDVLGGILKEWAEKKGRRK